MEDFGRDERWPGLIDDETMWLIDRCHDQFDREITRRHPNHRLWCMPLTRGPDRISFYVSNLEAIGNIPRRVIAERTNEVLNEYMESHRGALDIDYVCDSGQLACRLEYWSLDPPILTEVSGGTSAVAMFKFRYFYRNNEPVNSLTVALLDR